ncbi:putative pectinesterase [Dioscorea sansibarensis]
MYAFEDFNDYSYESEKRKSRKKKLIIIGVSLLAITLIVAAGVVGALFYTNHEPKKDDNHNLHSVSKSVKMMCSATDYSGVCESSLSKAVNSSSPAPEDLVKAAIAVIADEAKKAFSRSELFKSENPMIRGAIEDCKQLYLDSKEELETALKHIVADGLENLPKKSHDIRTWLSAVMSYQQTCIDGFPDGELKTKMNKAMDKARQLTSNALAIIKEATSFFSTLKLSNFNRRRLLEEEKEEVFVDDDGYPSWVAEGDRRMLKEYSWKKPTPNVTVAKDGSGM